MAIVVEARQYREAMALKTRRFDLCIVLLCDLPLQAVVHCSNLCSYACLTRGSTKTAAHAWEALVPGGLYRSQSQLAIANISPKILKAYDCSWSSLESTPCPFCPCGRGHVCQLSVPIARSSWASLHLPRCASLPLGTSFGQVVPHLKISAENPALHSIPILDPQECPAGIG